MYIVIFFVVEYILLKYGMFKLRFLWFKGFKMLFMCVFKFVKFMIMLVRGFIGL